MAKAKKKKNTTKQTTISKKNKPTLSIQKILGGILILAIILYLVLSNILNKSGADQEYMFKKQGELTFLTQQDQVKAKIDIQIADNDFDRELGLMYRKSMEENQGMLFIFPQETIQTFWMRNTLIPLDMIFINSKKDIVTIRNATKTLSDQTYASSEPAKYVLEVNAGYCKRFNIKEGDKIAWSRTKNE